MHFCGKINISVSVSLLEKRGKEILHLKDKVTELSLDAELVEPSRNDVLARDLVELRVKIDNCRFEIFVPSKANFVFEIFVPSIGKRLAGLRKKTFEHSDICDFLVDSMSELKFYGYIERYIERILDLDRSSCPE